MLKLEFENAQVKDYGYGLEVNGNSLSEIISTALGTRVGSEGGYGSGLPQFTSNCCDVVVVITPKPTITHIEDSENEYFSVEDLEEDKKAEYERIKAENAEADPEE